MLQTLEARRHNGCNKCIPRWKLVCAELLLAEDGLPQATGGRKEYIDDASQVTKIVEWFNARLKIFWGLDDGTVIGSRRCHGHVGDVLIVHLAFAQHLARQQNNDGSFGSKKL